MSLYLFAVLLFPCPIPAHAATKLAKPIRAERFPATSSKLDRSLIIGSAIFGVGWGLGGMCPGPALLVLAAGIKTGGLMVAGMVVGMLLHGVYAGWATGRPVDETGRADQEAWKS